ncbi:MAG: hypothetical protein JSS66_05600 [Armatimonadetes bacterium]|nr:hypothetical protein [Armatimonadota bacterium]
MKDDKPAYIWPHRLADRVIEAVKVQGVPWSEKVAAVLGATRFVRDEEYRRPLRGVAHD